MVYKIGLLLAFLVTWLGFIGPYAVSSESNELVIGWFVVTFVALLITISKLVKSKKVKKWFKNIFN
jgi:hypothetical protein